jgi:hypothetical protein
MLALLTPEQQRDLLGCPVSSTSCMAELATALGVDGTVTGHVRHVDGEYDLEFSVISPSGAELATYSKHVVNEPALLDAIKEASNKLTETLTSKLHKGVVHPKIDLAAMASKREYLAQDLAIRRQARIPFVAGLTLAAGGGLLVALSKNNYDSLEGAGARQGLFASLGAGRHAAAIGNTEQTVGLALIGGAAVGVLTGSIMYGLGRPEKPNTVMLVPADRGLGVVGVFP